jgi:N-acyl-D-amino-acid deacylase
MACRLLLRVALLAVPVVSFLFVNSGAHSGVVESDPNSSVQSEKPTAIVGATLIDGSGGRPLRNAVVILEGESIIAVGRNGRVRIPDDANVIDANGLVVAPGFIDTHNHSERGLDRDPSAESQVSQGITTIAVGQDGGSEFPVGNFLKKLDEHPVALNVLTFVGHATLRTLAMGENNTKRNATSDEIKKMQTMVEQAMVDGAFGLSTGLEYETAKPASTEEVIALASVAARHRGIYISHIRDEADDTLAAIAEAIRIGSQARLPVQISHIKVATVAVWGRSREVISLVKKAHARGQDITADCYPYDAWNSTIRVLIPSGNHDNPADVARGLADVGGPSNITVVSCRAHPDYEFKTLEQIAAGERVTPVELYMKIVRDGGASIVCRSMKESDIKNFYQQPWVMISSDGGIGSRHPRGAGTYPRVLGRFVRQQHWLTLAEAIRKMTSLPAVRLRLADRGLIRAHMKADLVLLDPLRVIDRSTFQQPGLISEGIKHVFVNGVEVWRDGRTTGQRPGKALRRE